MVVNSSMIGDFSTDQIIDIVDTLESMYNRRTFYDMDSYRVLIRTILSQRTRDENTDQASDRLFSVYPTMSDIANAPVDKIAELVHCAGFYNVKAKRIKEVSKILIDEYDGVVPDTVNELMKLPGVGRKTANCVMVFGFDKEAIPVDVHVHRISNRLGLVHTQTPEETEEVLCEIVPMDYWIPINDLMVQFGQTICRPISPKHDMCPFVGVCEFYNSRD